MPSLSSFSPPAYRRVAVANGRIFYREAGPPEAPTVVLLHGFPSSSHMFRNLIPELADEFHVVAPDYPGFGYSEAPPPGHLPYTFDRLADVMEQFLDELQIGQATFYLHDYGAPVGFRLATRRPALVEALVIQNANAYREGLGPEVDYLAPFWADRTPATEQLARNLLTPESTVHQYAHGVRDLSLLSPDAWTLDQAFLDRPGNDAIQLDLLHDYRNNPPLYPAWQSYLRHHRPPTLVVWGKNDPIFTEAGARAYLRDVPDAELHLIDSGHFALEDSAATIAPLIIDFLRRRLPTRQPASSS